MGITASGVPLSNIKEIQARLWRISEKGWEAFHIQTITGTVLQVQVDYADYSPRIYEMLQSSRLTQFRTEKIHCVSPLTPSDCQELAKVVEKSGADGLYIDLEKNSSDTVKRLYELCPGVRVHCHLDLEKNSPDTVKRLCKLCPGVRVDVSLRERGAGGWCHNITFSPHTDNINMSEVYLNPGDMTRLHQLLSLAQSWTVRDYLWLHNLGPEDWTELSVLLDTLDSVWGVEIRSWSAPPSVSLLETLWNKTQEGWVVDDDDYYKKNEEDFSKLVKHFQ